MMKTISRSTMMTAGVALLLVASVTSSSGITNVVDVNTSWSFEGYTNGESIVDTATDSWYGSEADSLLGLTNSYTEPAGGYPISGNHDVVMELTSDASNLVESADLGSVWIDHIVKPTRWDQEGHPSNNLPSDAQMAYYVNTNNHMVLYHTEYIGGALGNKVWTEIPELEIGSNEWIRVSINMDHNWFGDFLSCYFRVKVNGQTLTNALAKSGEFFAMATESSATMMNAIQLQGTGKFDDFVVTTTEPIFNPAETTWTITATVAEGATGGEISPSGAVVVTDGSNQLFTVATSNYWSVTKFVIVENGVTSTNTSTTYTFNNVLTNGSIAAYFARDTTNGVPVEWMATFGILGQSPTNDPDNDGFTTAEEYIASTHPTNGMSYLRILRSWQADGTNYVEWESEGIDSGLPDFVVESTDNLINGFAPTGTVVRGATNTWIQAVPTGDRIFYRIQAGDGS